MTNIKLLILLLLVMLFNVATCCAEVRWKEATAGKQFAFPQDHASHDRYRIEWWYYTGNVATAEGRRFGYQLTFFRIGVNPDAKNPSAWTIKNLAMAHFALSDISRQQFYSHEKLDRAALGRAGADATTLHVWNGDWSAQLDKSDLKAHRLSAEADNISINLTLRPETEPIIHGVNGISIKGESAGNASHYYSFPRMATSGKLTVGNEQFSVEGESWMDHEFGTSFLEEGQAGWDWFSVQLDSGDALMVFQMRRRDGSRDENSSGTLIHRDGSVRHLLASEIKLVSGDSWTSPATGGRYPIEWNIEVPELKPLVVRAAFPAQELTGKGSGGVKYWEGSIEVRQSDALVGRGYLEMTGYAGAGMSALLTQTSTSESAPPTVKAR